MRSGQRIGKYVLGEPIARGGMAEVWAAQVEGPGGFVKPLALKFILESFAADPELERLFVNEARLAARLQHANLVTVFDFDRMQESEGAPPGRYYIAMERVDGHDLRRVAQAAALRTRRIPPSIALYVAAEVLRGLRYVHERRDEPSGRRLELVHRDVSPHNVLIGMGGEVKLSDFGIAKARALHHTVDTRAGTVRGKLAYAAPEQLRSESLDHRADQFAMGIVLWELLAGRRLFDGASEMEIAEKVLAGAIPPLPAAAGVASAVEDLARRMLSARPRDRFGSTAEALSAVMAAPGYQADPAPLVALMHELFPPQHLPVAPTAPVELPDPLALAVPQKRQMPPTIPMDMGRAAPPAGASAAGAVTVNRPLFESSGDGSGSYVSDVGASRWSRAARGRQRAVGSPARRLIVGLVAVALVGGGAGVAIRRLRAARMKNTTAATSTSAEAGAGTTAGGGAAGTAGTDSVSPPAASSAPPSSPAPTATELPKPSPPLPLEAPPDDQPGRRGEPSGPPATPAPTAASPPTQVQAPPFPRAVLPLASGRGVPSPPTALAPIPPNPAARPPAPPPATAPEAAVTPPFLPPPPPATPPAAAKQRRGTAPNAAPILE